MISEDPTLTGVQKRMPFKNHPFKVSEKENCMLTESVIRIILFINNRFGYSEGRIIVEKFLALSEEKRTKIRNAALSCFAQHGYDKASINDIAKAAGISKASMFQYFGNKRALYEYLFDYCSSQMKQAYDQHALVANTDFFDRVWEASVMKVENLKKHPYVSAFIASAAIEQASELKDTLNSLMKEGEKYTQTLILRREDLEKFKHPEDAQVLFQTLMLLARGMAFQMENGADYDGIMAQFEIILKTLKQNFYKEVYL